jgi:hypothetical protein
MSLVPKKRGETIEKQIKESKDPRSYWDSFCFKQFLDFLVY